MQAVIQLFQGPASIFGTALLGLCVLCALLMNELTKKKKGTVSVALQAKEVEAQEEEEEDGRDQCTLVFGTQTGTAEKFAKTLKSQLESAYGSTTAFHVVDAEQYKAQERLSKETLVIFLVATYGDGEPTDNAVDLHDYLVEESGKVDYAELPLDGVSFAVFALGNRQYEHFCSMGKTVHKCMSELGATPLLAMGTGDDDDDIDRDFDEWSAKFFEALKDSELFEAGVTAQVTTESVPAYSIQKIMDAPASSVNKIINGRGDNVHSPYLAEVTCVKELHGDASDRSCVHVEVDISGSQTGYEAGDHIGVYPENLKDVVKKAAELLGKPLDFCFSMTKDDRFEDLGEVFLPGAMTLEFALTHFADLLSSPSKAALKMLSAFATDAKERERLVMLCSVDGVAEYDAYVHVPKRSLLEVLEDFPSAKPTIGAFFGSISPRLQPRYYSISSSPKVHPTSVHITCAVVRDIMPTGRVHNGVASTWLARVRVGQKIPVFLRSSSFKLPQNRNAPVIMVGPGTGFAPFRGFIQDRRADSTSAEMLLYFGCRHTDHDFIYEEEMKSAVEDGTLSKLELAFSREGKAKDYVQHHIEKDGSHLWSLLSNKKNPGYLYICGDGKHMAKDVNRVLHHIVEKEEGCSGNQAEAIVKKMADQGRYLKDVW
mmetsp:Transcript_6849/g.13626  ORF Transcript_6849/g.13626 Transcript_6849/m.13626 type:complete len:656 (+) Transcript_6849:68-2035(+)